MTKYRRIEITAFRRRTTIVLRDRSKVGPTERPPEDGESPCPTRADPAQVAQIDLDQTQITNPDAAERIGLKRGRDTNDRPDN
jgi:hypothetical protein